MTFFLPNIFFSFSSDEQPAEAVVTAPCDSCGRSFNVASLPRHAAVCRRVFVQKRAALDMAAVRVAELVDSSSSSSSSASAVDARREAAVAANRAKQKWKKESSSFRDALRAARE